MEKKKKKYFSHILSTFYSFSNQLTKPSILTHLNNSLVDSPSSQFLISSITCGHETSSATFFENGMNTPQTKVRDDDFVLNYSFNSTDVGGRNEWKIRIRIYC